MKLSCQNFVHCCHGKSSDSSFSIYHLHSMRTRRSWYGCFFSPQNEQRHFPSRIGRTKLPLDRIGGAVIMFDVLIMGTSYKSCSSDADGLAPSAFIVSSSAFFSNRQPSILDPSPDVTRLERLVSGLFCGSTKSARNFGNGRTVAGESKYLLLVGDHRHFTFPFKWRLLFAKHVPSTTSPAVPPTGGDIKRRCVASALWFCACRSPAHRVLMVHVAMRILRLEAVLQRQF